MKRKTNRGNAPSFSRSTYTVLLDKSTSSVENKREKRHTFDAFLDLEKEPDESIIFQNDIQYIADVDEDFYLALKQLDISPTEALELAEFLENVRKGKIREEFDKHRHTAYVRMFTRTLGYGEGQQYHCYGEIFVNDFAIEYLIVREEKTVTFMDIRRKKA